MPMTATLLSLLLVLPAQTTRPLSGDSPGGRLVQEVQTALSAKRVDDALRIAERGLKEHPDDIGVQRCYVDLHLSIAEWMIRNEAYPRAEELIREALRVSPDEFYAHKLLQKLADGRRAIDQRLGDCRAWIRLEWFEPAVVTLRQATRLASERKREWISDYVAASIGAGDDQYFCKNFADAWDRYAPVIAFAQKGELPEEQLAACAVQALQSLVLGLPSGAHALGHREKDWDSLRAAARTLMAVATGRNISDANRLRAGQTAHAVRLILDGLSRERAGDPPGAVRLYAKAANKNSLSGDVVAAREAALTIVRDAYAEELSARREGPWRDASDGDWQVIDAQRFRIHHRNAFAAQRVQIALGFHVERLAKYLGRRSDDLAWPVPCDVFIHPTAESFRSALNATGEVHGSTVLKTRDRKLESIAIHLFQRDPMLLASTIPHELAHAMFAAATDYRPVPAIIREGVALTCEPDCRRKQWQRFVPPRPMRRPISDLLALVEVHPAGRNDFYGEAFALVDFLVDRSNMSDLVDACRANSITAELPARMFVASMDDLERMWRGTTSTRPTTQP